MAYYSAAYPPRSTRDHFIEPPSIVKRFFTALPHSLAVLLQKILGWTKSTLANSHTLRVPRTLHEAQQRFHPRRLLNLPNAFIVIWILVLLWGERWVFEGSINECQWASWERWVSLQLPRRLHTAANTKPFIATHSDTSSLDISCRSAIDRPSFLPRPAMAALNAYDFTYRQLSQALLHPAPEISTSRHYILPWRPF